MSYIRFIPVAELNDPLTLAIGLSGGSGTGKTYTALRIARGIADVCTGRAGSPIGYVDTENRRALHYKAAFPEMLHFDMQAVDADGKMLGFNPERWIAVIDAAEAANLSVLVIDSFSHAWEGVGGVLDLHAQTLDRLTRGDDSKKDARSQLAWAEVKPRYRRLIDRIVRAKTNIIICTRAKPVMQDFKTKLNARPTKTRRADVPWDPAADADLMFEMTTMVILDPSAAGCPVHQIKVADQFKSLLDPRRPMDEATGRAMAEWAKGQGSAQEQKALMDSARIIARGGSDAFREWWKITATKAQRATLQSIIGELQAIATDADSVAAQAENDEPFANVATTTDPEPHAAIAISREQRQALEAVTETILDRIKAGESADEIRAMFADQIAQISEHAPDLAAKINAVQS